MPSPPKTPVTPVDPGASPRDGGTRLPLPHERDEKLGHVDPKPAKVIEQAKKDLDSGQVDTDMRATPGLDAAARAKLVPTPPEDEPRAVAKRSRRAGPP